MRAVTDVDLIECKQILAIIDPGDDHRPLFALEQPIGGRGHDPPQCAGAMAHQNTVVTIRVRIDSDDYLTGHVASNVGHEPVLADRHHNVLRFEQKRWEIGPVNAHPSPVGRDGPENETYCLILRVLPFLELSERLTPLFEEETHLTGCSVASEHSLQLRGPGDDDHAGNDHRCPSRSSAPLATRRCSIGPSASAPTARCSMAGRLPASSRAARPYRTDTGRSR